MGSASSVMPLIPFSCRAASKGFTLIELLIVVTLIGILAAIAVPVYQDYTIRARVSESAVIFSPIKTAIIMYLSDRSELPEDLAALGLSPSAFEGEYVASLSLKRLPGGQIGEQWANVSIRMKDNPLLGAASGKQVVYVGIYKPDKGSIIDWTISNDPNNPDPTHVPTKFL